MVSFKWCSGSVLAGAGLVIAANIASPASAQEAAGGEDISPETLASSWINLFDGETLYGWTPAEGSAAWTVEGGLLVSPAGKEGLLATTSQFKDFELRARIRTRPGATARIMLRHGGEVGQNGDGATVVPIIAETEGVARWRDVRVTARGADLNASVDGYKVSLNLGKRAIGHIALGQRRGEGAMEVAELQLRPLGLDPLFNGKNLNGWHIVPDHTSKFSVIDGALNIKDGNGQIETEAVFQNFVLQMAIFSNGTRLNSGVFFRSPKGTFWRGYESQIRNEWKGDDRTKPVDYGTGGIYGIQPTRKVVSSDREWFTKTIICQGKHIAVWIDGLQVSDFTDTRRRAKGGRAKKGFVGDAGTIHLQGHDPTTDLSFKDIRIQAY
jgi:hypothetical protein